MQRVSSTEPDASVDHVLDLNRTKLQGEVTTQTDKYVANGFSVQLKNTVLIPN